jgi:hypothetical protein
MDGSGGKFHRGIPHNSNILLYNRLLEYWQEVKRIEGKAKLITHLGEEIALMCVVCQEGKTLPFFDR